jgi:hypothetical protein
MISFSTNGINNIESTTFSSTSPQIFIHPSGVGNKYSIGAATPLQNTNITFFDPNVPNCTFNLSNTGGLVFQSGSNNTPVTLNARGGIIQMFGNVLTNNTFTLFNSYISNSSFILAFSTNTSCIVNFASVNILVTSISSGQCNITITSPNSTSTMTTPLIQFLVI